MRNHQFVPIGSRGLSDFHPGFVDGLDHRVASDELFAGLDGAELTAADARWRVEVYSVTESRNSRWIQLGATGPRRHLATFQVSDNVGPNELRGLLSSWLDERFSTDDCV